MNIECPARACGDEVMSDELPLHDESIAKVAHVANIAEGT